MATELSNLTQTWRLLSAVQSVNVNSVRSEATELIVNECKKMSCGVNYTVVNATYPETEDKCKNTF